MLMRMSFLPASRSRVIVSRSWMSPDPIVIFPLSSMIDTFPESRTVAFMPISSLLWLLGHQLLFQHDLRAAEREIVSHIVHERLHVENAAPGRLQPVLGSQWVGDLIGRKT